MKHDLRFQRKVNSIARMLSRCTSQSSSFTKSTSFVDFGAPETNLSDGWRQEAKTWVPAPSNAIIVAAALNQREFHRTIEQRICSWSHWAVSTWCPCWCHAFAKFSWETLLWIPQSRANLNFRWRNQPMDISEVAALLKLWDVSDVSQHLHKIIILNHQLQTKVEPCSIPVGTIAVLYYVACSNP